MSTPNVLCLNWHDAGRHFGCYGVETVHTPHIDRLAANGVLFERCFAASTVCSPSRGALLTGRYPQSNGLRGLCHGNFPWQLHSGHDHLSHLLRARGWHTALAGFQHEARHEDIARLGFLERIETHGRGPWHQAPCEFVAEGAADFLRRRRADGKAFYLQVGFFETHRPYDWGGATPDCEKGVWVPPYIVDNATARDDMAALQGAIRKADAQAGRVLAALEETGLADNTIVLFTTDHGLALPRSKGTMHDEGMGVAFVLRWPRGGLRGGRRSARMISNVDYVPTLFELLGLEPRPEFDGHSFADELGPWSGAEPRSFVHCLLADEMRAVRHAGGKLIYTYEDLADYPRPVNLDWIPASSPGQPLGQRRDLHVAATRPVPRIEYYDLRKDPAEMDNIAGHPDYLTELRYCAAEMTRWMERTGDPLASQPAPGIPRRRSNHF